MFNQYLQLEFEPKIAYVAVTFQLFLITGLASSFMNVSLTDEDGENMVRQTS